MNKFVNKIILKHLACSYIMYCKVSFNDTLSFEKLNIVDYEKLKNAIERWFNYE